eukprot:COSAG06_NODE_19249_length_846_cov_1.650602_1_plen_175_part_00
MQNYEPSSFQQEPSSRAHQYADARANGAAKSCWHLGLGQARDKHRESTQKRAPFSCSDYGWPELLVVWQAGAGATRHGPCDRQPDGGDQSDPREGKLLLVLLTLLIRNGELPRQAWDKNRQERKLKTKGVLRTEPRHGPSQLGRQERVHLLPAVARAAGDRASYGLPRVELERC